MGFSGTVQIQERQKTAEKVRLSDLDGVKDLLQRHVALTDRVSDGELIDIKATTNAISSDINQCCCFPLSDPEPG